MLVIFFAGRRAGHRSLVLLFLLLVVLDFASDHVEDLGLSSQEERMTEDVFAGVFATLVEAVHIELSNEGVDVAVSEVFGKDVVLEVINLFDGELPSVGHPVNDRLVVFVFEDLETFLYEIGNRCVNILA